MHGVVCRVWFNVCDACYVYVLMVEEKALGACWVWKSIWSVYRIRKKVEAKD